MSEVIALAVHIIDVKDNFVHLDRKYLNKFRNPNNDLGIIKIDASRVHYASCFAVAYNGNGENAFNISSTFAKTLTVNDSDTVVISNQYFVQSLRTVLVSPVSVDDLPIMEDRAETIQAILLNQIRIVVKHQILTIWVSKSVSVQVHVDRLDNDLNYGRLEEHTEVAVSLNVNTCDDCNNLKSDIQEIKLASPWNMFKNIFGFNTPVDHVPAEEKPSELKFCTEGIFRCVLIDEDVFKLGEHVQLYPYNVFISSRHRVRNKENICSLCRLTHLPYTPPLKSTNEVKEQYNEILSSEIFVHLYEVNEAEVVNRQAYFQINSYPTVFVSRTIFCTLRLKINSKVKLETVTNEGQFKPTQIDYTVIRGETDEDNLVPEVKNVFKDSAQFVVNNGHLFAMDQYPDVILYFSFNPISLPFVVMSKSDIRSCSFYRSQRELNLTLEGDIKESETRLIPLDFQRNILHQLKMSLLLRLQLVRPPREDYDLSFENSYHTIMEGDIGTGKSSMLMLLKDHVERCSYQIFSKRVECKMLKGKLISKLEKLLEAALIECLHHEPAVLCLDDLDVLFTSSKQNTQAQSQPSITSYSNRLSHVIFDLIYKYSKFRVTVLATVKNCSGLESRLFQVRGVSLFSDRIVIPVMNQAARLECLVQLLSRRPNLVYDAYLNELVRRTEGYCVQDLRDLVEKLYFELLKRSVDFAVDEFVWSVQQEDVEICLSSLVPLALADINLLKSSSVSWKDVGGLEQPKSVLAEVLIWPSQFPEIFEQCPLKLQSGVLLYGAPGSGKTLLASAVAGESGLNFISVKGPELLSKFVGESEEGVRNTFRKARNAKPCILFFDEFDSLAPRRGNDITGVTDRVVNQLLTELDGVESVSGVWVLAATSRPDLIDPALLRPGRLGTIVCCSLPNREERRSILEIMSKDLPEIHGQIDWDAVAEATTSYTGADLKAVLYAAVNMCDTAKSREVEALLARKDLSNASYKEESKMSKIDTTCLIEAVRETPSSLKSEELCFYEMIYARFERRDESINYFPVEQRVTLA